MHIRSKDRLGKFLHIPDGGILNDLVAAGTERRFKLIPQLQFDSQLWDAAYAFAELHRNNPTADAEALKNLKLISKSVACSNASRAFANYVLGFSFVWKARQSGTLQKLWSNSGRDDACPFLTKAQHHYKEAFHLLGSVCDLLKRNITRCLALVTGPSDYSCALVLASIGAAIFPSSIYDEKLKEENKTILDLLNTFDGMGKLNAESSHVLDELAKKSPPGWRYVASALCPTGEMLLASIDRDDNGESAACRVCCIFPTQKSGPQSTSSLFPASVFDEVMRPLNEIMHKSRHQLLSVLDAVAKEEKHSYRRQWWKGREDVDSKLRDLILATETRILEDPLAHQILVGSEDFNAENERMNDENSAHLARANLASRFEAVSYDSTRCRLSKLKASDLRDELLKKGFKSQSLQKMKKTELIELIITQTEEGSVTMQEIDIELNSRKEKEKDNEHCIFLILDENLQRFPFESMRCFQDKTICRLPTIQIALLRLLGTNREHKYWTSVFDMRKTSYVLDPESNLSGTKERLLPYLEGFNKRNDNMWQSVVGKIPHASFITDSLRKEHGLFLYFGHGGGQKYISRKDIESLKQTPTRTISSVILMGCSSGKLESVNIRGSGFLGELPIQYEPEGIALSYLLAGSPCVVGNLWDVTDRDIDRFSIELLEQLFGSDINYSIARSVAHVRTACKMRYIVGSAPVCYGFPVFPAN
jgi:separase